MAYVSVSRAQFDVQMYTNDAKTLGQELSRDVSHPTAIQQEPAATQKIEPQSVNIGDRARLERGLRNGRLPISGLTKNALILRRRGNGMAGLRLEPFVWSNRDVGLMAESAYAVVSKTIGSNPVWVQVPLKPPDRSSPLLSPKTSAKDSQGN